MKQMIWILSSLLFSFSAQSLVSKGCGHNSKQFSCIKFLKNYDGDTFTANIPMTHPLIGKKIRIRVNGIDTPEMRGKTKCEKEKAKTAKKLTYNLLKKANRIDLKNVKRGKYFRIAADVKFDGKDLGQILIKNRLAYKYNGGKKRKVDWCRF